MNVDGDDRDLARASRLVKLLDRRYLDPLLGLLLPQLGDAITACVGLSIVATAIKKKAPPVLLARMLMNLGLDLLVGLVPLLGDLFDFAFRANERNLALLRARLDQGGKVRSRPGDWLLLLLGIVIFIAPLILGGYLLAKLIAWL